MALSAGIRLSGVICLSAFLAGCGGSSACDDPSLARVGRQRTAEGGSNDEAWRCRMRAGNGVVRVEVGKWVIWERFAPVLRGLVENSKDF